MKTSELIIWAINRCKKYGFDYVRNCLWDLRYIGKITEKQLLETFKILHQKGY